MKRSDGRFVSREIIHAYYSRTIKFPKRKERRKVMGEVNDILTTAVNVDGTEVAGEIVPTASLENLEDDMGVLLDTTDELSFLAKIIAGLAAMGGIGGIIATIFGIKKLWAWIQSKREDDDDEEDDRPRKKSKRKSKKAVTKGKKATKKKSEPEEDEDDDDDEDEESEE